MNWLSSTRTSPAPPSERILTEVPRLATWGIEIELFQLASSIVRCYKSLLRLCPDQMWHCDKMPETVPVISGSSFHSDVRRDQLDVN